MGSQVKKSSPQKLCYPFPFQYSWMQEATCSSQSWNDAQFVRWYQQQV